MCDKMRGLSETDIAEINGLFESVMRENGELEVPNSTREVYDLYFSKEVTDQCDSRFDQLLAERLDCGQKVDRNISLWISTKP